MEFEFNEYQSTIEELGINKCPQEIQEQFTDFIYNIPLVQNLTSPIRKRAKDLPRDEQGKIIVDITNPHILEDMDYFRPAALHFLQYGCYTSLRPNRNPNSDYGKWIREETRRCREGYIRESDGEWIPGDYYFFLNYCPMLLSEKDNSNSKKANRVMSFPKIWDGHYLKFHYLWQARNNGKHAVELASRQKGKTFCAAALLTKRFGLGESEKVKEKVTCYATASEKGFLVKGDQTLDKFQYNIDFLAQNTEWPYRDKLINTIQNMQWVAGYKDLDTETRRGTLNAVMGTTAKDDESKLRGTRGVLYIIEEAGSFPRLLQLWNNLLPSVQDGEDTVYGILFAFGCVCKDTIVYKFNGEPILIQDVQKNDKLLGYNGNKSTSENISWLQPIGYKECVRIYTEKANYLDCSVDHPILAINKDKFGNSLGTCSFYKANELKIGDTLLMPKKIGEFGHINEPHAFLLGALFGDGSYSGNQCVTLSICTEEEYEYYNNHYDIGISKLSKGSNTYAQLYFRGLNPLLQKYGMDKQSFERKTLPNNIFDWDKASVCAFLGGYFNADGNIQIIKKKHRSIKLTCKYNKPLEQVKCLLHKLGISSHVYKEHKPARTLHSNVNQRDYKMSECDAYVLYISNSKDIHIFKENIKLLIKNKQERLDSYTYRFKKGIADNLKFQLRDNGKGALLEGNIFNNLQMVTIKKIEPLGVQRIYNMTADTTHTYISNGFISSNTSGDSQSDFSAMAEIMYKPRGYHVYRVENVYDLKGKGGKDFAFFFPAYMNFSGCYDSNGNSNVTKAILALLKNRYNIKYNSTDISTITRTIAEYPITPQEAVLRTTGSIFPTALLTERLNEIDSNPNIFDDVYTGDLFMNSKGEVQFKLTNELPIRDYPLKDNTASGCFEIFQMPEKDKNDKVTPYRYIASLDPYNNDQAESKSLGSFFVLDLLQDRIVCEYTGRTPYLDDFFEKVRLACIFYNAKCLYESNLKGAFSYFSKKNSLHLLADTPEYLRDKQIIKYSNFGSSSKGVNASKAVNVFADNLTRDWLLKSVPIIEDEGNEAVERSVPNLYFIKNRALLRELISYNPYDNFDRIRSIGILMLYREEKMILYQGDVKPHNNYDDLDYASNDEFFTENYDRRFDTESLNKQLVD